jgi:glutaredoxin
MAEKRVQVEMFSRPGCHLCDDALKVINDARTRYAFDFRVINVDEDAERASAYVEQIPVIHINGSKAFKFQVDPSELESKLERLWNL